MEYDGDGDPYVVTDHEATEETSHHAKVSICDPPRLIEGYLPKGAWEDLTDWIGLYRDELLEVWKALGAGHAPPPVPELY